MVKITTMGSLVSKQSKPKQSKMEVVEDNKDAPFIGKNQHSARDAIYAAYPNHEVRFISMDPGEPYIPLNRDPYRINVIYNSETLLITEVRHE
jgi:hypothetical protein